MGSTSNFELEKIAEFLHLNLISVCQKDQLDEFDKVDNGFYIINNQSSADGDGTHWTCLYLNKKESFFFCSYGAPPSNEIIVFCRGFTKRLKTNNSIIQSLHSNNCGYYCLGFILFMTHNNYNYMEFIKSFQDSTRRNDLILEGLMRIYTYERKKIPKELTRFYNLNYKN